MPWIPSSLATLKATCRGKHDVLEHPGDVSKSCRGVDDTGNSKIMIVMVEVIRRMVVVVGGYSYKHTSCIFLL